MSKLFNLGVCLYCCLSVLCVSSICYSNMEEAEDKDLADALKVAGTSHLHNNNLLIDYFVYTNNYNYT